MGLNANTGRQAPILRRTNANYLGYVSQWRTLRTKELFKSQSMNIEMPMVAQFRKLTYNSGRGTRRWHARSRCMRGTSGWDPQLLYRRVSVLGIMNHKSHYGRRMLQSQGTQSLRLPRIVDVEVCAYPFHLLDSLVNISHVKSAPAKEHYKVNFAFQLSHIVIGTNIMSDRQFYRLSTITQPPKRYMLIAQLDHFVSLRWQKCC